MSSEHPLEALVGPKLLKGINPDGARNIRNFRSSFHNGPSISLSEAVIGKDLVLLYFSAAWCPPCKQFSPILKDFYKAQKDSRIEVIYVSSDRDPREFQDNFGTHPWLAVESQQYKDILTRKCHVRGIPTLLVLDAATGHFVTDQARGEVMSVGGDQKKGEALIEKWKATQAVPLEQATFTSAGGCAIL